MSIASEIICQVCIHEAAHCLVALHMGLQVETIDIFDLYRNCKGAAGKVIIRKNGSSNPHTLAAVDVAAEAAEEICGCRPACGIYPLAARAMAGNPPPPAAHRGMLSAACFGDFKNFLNNMAKVRPPNHMRFFQECKFQAAAILIGDRATLDFRARELEQMAYDAKVHERIPKNGIPDDGPHWTFRLPNKPPLNTIAEHIRQWKELSEWKPQTTQLTN